MLQLASNLGWLFADKIFRAGGSLVFFIWLARYLGPEKFGLLSLAIAFVGIFGSIAALGLQSIVVREIVLDSDNKHEILGTTAALHSIAGIFAYCLAILAIFFLRDDGESRLLVGILGVAMLFKGAWISIYWFESQVQSKYSVWVQNSNFFAFLLVKFLFILNDASIVNFALILAAEAIFEAVFLLLLLNMRSMKIRQLRIAWSRLKSLISDAWPVFLSSVFVVIYMKIDQVMLAHMLGDEAVGHYTAALQLSEAWYSIPMIILASFFPSLLKAREKNREEYYIYLQRLFDLMSSISVVVAVIVAIFSSLIINVLYGPTYSDASKVLEIHIWSSIFVFMGVVSARWFLAENLQILMLWRVFTTAVVNIVLNYLLIPIYGITGAAIALLIAQSMGFLAWDYMRRDTRVIFFMKLASLNPIRRFSRLFL